jgi:hypothetical protein
MPAELNMILLATMPPVLELSEPESWFEPLLDEVDPDDPELDPEDDPPPSGSIAGPSSPENPGLLELPHAARAMGASAAAMARAREIRHDVMKPPGKLQRQAPRRAVRRRGSLPRIGRVCCAGLRARPHAALDSRGGASLASPPCHEQKTLRLYSRTPRTCSRFDTLKGPDRRELPRALAIRAGALAWPRESRGPAADRRRRF